MTGAEVDVTGSSHGQRTAPGVDVTAAGVEVTVAGDGRRTTAAPRRSDPRAYDVVAVAVAGVLAVVVPTVTLLDLPVPGRLFATVAFLVTVPGVPLGYALRLPHRLVTVVLAICLSISAPLLAVAVTAVLGVWDPFTVVTAIAAIGLLATPAAVAAIQRSEPADQAALPVADEPDPPEQAAGRAGQAGRWVGFAAVGVALILWWWATRQLDAANAGALGLIAVAPIGYWLALGVLAGVLGWALLRPVVDHVLLAVACVATAVCGYLLVGVADGAAGYSTVWVHVGFIDFVSRTGELATGADARFSWPGFLAGSAYLVAVAGLPDASAFTLVAPVAFTVLALPALWLIGRLVTGSARLAWLGVVLYLAFNWYQQDYFSAQATGFVLYTGVLAVLLWAFDAADVPALPGRRWLSWLRAVHRIPGRPGPAGDRLSGTRMVWLEIALTLVVAALVVTHQLTPITLVVALLWFVLAGGTRMRTLWLSAAAMFVGWFSYGATGFWTGHLADLLGDLGRLGSTVSSGVGERIVGDPLYQQMQFTRIAWTGLLGLGGVVGWWLIRRRRIATLAAGLAATPAGLLLVQSYGGEVIIRCALYASPFLAPLAAVGLARVGQAVLRPLPYRRAPMVAGALRLGAVLATLMVTFAMLTLTRGLNVSFERVSAEQVAQARALIASAPDGARIGTVEAVGPLPLGGFARLDPEPVPLPGCRGQLRDCLLDQVGPDGASGPDFVYVTGGQEAAGRLRSGLAVGWTGQIIDVLLSTGGYRVVVRSAEVTVLERVAEAAADSESEESTVGSAG
ncbi:hypothetical protein ACN27J_18905 [Solwaraspora sp. WMMB762]|uniref:hypothetical protein n=1 Tax=Solwaraspora sp. WMMB762 TaxID=3404120 RepID=UPI003B948BCA